MSGLRVFLVLFSAYLAVRGALYEPLLLAAAPLLLFERTRRWGAVLGFLLEGRLIALRPFLASNHAFLEAWLFALLAVQPSRSREEAGGFVKALGFALAAAVFWSGLQKLAHGYYASGDYFRVEASQPGRLAEALDPLLPADERARLEAYRGELWRFAEEGSASAAPDAFFDMALPPAPRLTLLSRLFCALTLAAELLLPPLLLWGAWTPWAAGALAVFLLGVEVFAGEWHFGLLAAAMLAPFLAGPGSTREGRLRPAALALLALLALWPAVQLGLSARWELSPWKLGGFGMYSIPSPWALSRVYTREGGGQDWKIWKAAPEEASRAQAEADSLRNAPRAAGPARRLAALALRGAPEGASARIEVRTILYDRAEGRFKARGRSYLEP